MKMPAARKPGVDVDQIYTGVSYEHRRGLIAERVKARSSIFVRSQERDPVPSLSQRGIGAFLGVAASKLSDSKYGCPKNFQNFQ